LTLGTEIALDARPTFDRTDDLSDVRTDNFKMLVKDMIGAFR